MDKFNKLCYISRNTTYNFNRSFFIKKVKFLTRVKLLYYNLKNNARSRKRFDSNGLQSRTQNSDLKVSNLYNYPSLEKFEHYGHTLVIGPTNSGKTHRIKVFLCDQRFPNYDEFIYSGPKKEIDDLASCFCAQNYLDTCKWTDKTMKFFPLEKIQEAINYCEQSAPDNLQRLLFIDDALIQSNQISKSISNFVSQAKNSNTTLIITVHDPLGDGEKKAIRNAARYFVCINTTRDDLRRITTLESDSKILNKYDQLKARERFIIFDKNNREYFDIKYTPFMS